MSDKSRKKLLIIGAGDFQLPLVQQAAKTCDVVLAAPVISAAFEPYIADRLIVDVRDKESILSFARAQEIDGVITDQTDIAVRSVAYVAEQMGLPGIGYETGVLFTDKSRMRARLSELGLPLLPNRTVSSPDEAVGFFHQLSAGKTDAGRTDPGKTDAERTGVRVILKPLDTQGSRGVSVCANDREIRAKYDDAACWSSTHKVIVEQFATGREFVVESMVLNHEYRTLCIGDTLYFDIPDAFAAKSRIFPTTADDALREKVLSLDEKIIRGFGLRQGITHSEYIMEGDEVYLIETAARGGGVFISSDLIHLSSGLDTEQFLVNIALGQQKEMPGLLPQQSFCGYMAFYLPVGRVLRADGIDTVCSLPFVHRNQLGKLHAGLVNKEGATDKTSRIAVIVSGKTRDELMANMAEVRETLKIEVESPDGSVRTPIWD
ncbi:MAG: ATP-grasp domain-containing protein [Eubacteriales bacterium]|nr:ATP-grasp domain-containing protein [Eubacteriales bacterium]